MTAWAPSPCWAGAHDRGGALLGASRLGRRISAPVSELAAVAHRLRAGELEARAVPRGPAETVELGAAFNKLADRVGELLKAEREAVADLSHRLRTPVTASRLDVGAVTEPELAERLRDHIGHRDRTVNAIVKDARRPVSATVGRSCDAASVVRDRVAFWSALAADQGRDLTVSIPSRVTPVRLDAADLMDVVDALVDNVFAHTPDGQPLPSPWSETIRPAGALRPPGAIRHWPGSRSRTPAWGWRGWRLRWRSAAVAVLTPPGWAWTWFAGRRSRPAAI